MKNERDLAAATDLATQHKLVADLLAETERSMKELDKEMNRVKDAQYKRGQELFEVRNRDAGVPRVEGAQPDQVQALEIRLIQHALSEANGNKVRTAAILGITRQGLHKKMKRYGLDG